MIYCLSGPHCFVALLLKEPVHEHFLRRSTFKSLKIQYSVYFQTPLLFWIAARKKVQSKTSQLLWWSKSTLREILLSNLLNTSLNEYPIQL